MKTLNEAEKYIGSGDYKAFFSETAQAFASYLIAIMEVKSPSASKEDLSLLLQECGCPANLFERIEKAIDTGEMGRFSPTRYGTEEMEEFYHEIAAIIKACEETAFWKV